MGKDGSIRLGPGVGFLFRVDLGRPSWTVDLAPVQFFYFIIISSFSFPPALNVRPSLFQLFPRQNQSMRQDDEPMKEENQKGECLH